MAIWAIGDTHLSHSVDKTMDVFGAGWANYTKRIAENWCALVKPEDIVLVVGDISWGLKPEEAVEDLQFLDRLPGRKILLRGNHDYWWTTRKRVENLFVDNGIKSLEIFQNEALILEEAGKKILLIGTRAWKNPYDDDFNKEDEKVYLREIERLKLSLEEAKEIIRTETVEERLAIFHYPPVTKDGIKTEFAHLICEFGVNQCCYGHVHGHAARMAYEGSLDACYFHKVSADFLGFKPKRIM